MYRLFLYTFLIICFITPPFFLGNSQSNKQATQVTQVTQTLQSQANMKKNSDSNIKTFSGNLNQNGGIYISYSINVKQPFFLQAFILYEDNWRPISIFFNKSKVWLDLGPHYNQLPYIINLMTNIQ